MSLESALLSSKCRMCADSPQAKLVRDQAASNCRDGLSKRSKKAIRRGMIVFVSKMVSSGGWRSDTRMLKLLLLMKVAGNCQTESQYSSKIHRCFHLFGKNVTVKGDTFGLQKFPSSPMNLRF